MMRHPALLLLLSVCSAFGYEPCTGDLIFETAAPSDMHNAIVDATVRDDALPITHVGIVYVDSAAQAYVIEATGERGVVLTPFDAFCDSASGVVVKRITADVPIAAAIERALAFVGRPYDWWYLPDNDALYCSELVEKCFLYADGTPVFKTKPMNFRDPDGRMPQFWTDLFAQLGRPVPEGLPGTNPADMARSPILQEVWRSPQNACPE